MKKKIKVLMLGNDPSVKGGITSVITQLLDYDWSVENVDMSFIPTYIEANNVKKVLFFTNAYRKIEHEMKHNKPDVVHIHMSYRGSFIRKFAIHKMCVKYGVPDIIHLHGSEFEKWYDESAQKKKAQIRTLLKECKAFIVLGEKWNEFIKMIEPSTNSIVVNNTVHIPQETVKWNQPVQVLFLGVLIKRKGVSDLLNAIKILKDVGKATNVKFVIAGSGAEEDELKKQIVDLNIENLTDFAGWTVGEKKVQLLKNSQIMVLPSYNEGLPIAILEAISYGMPVVATNVGDISSAVSDGKNGFLIQPGDIEALADRLGAIITDKALYEEMSYNSRKLAEERFSDLKYFEQLSIYYSKIGEKSLCRK